MYKIPLTTFPNQTFVVIVPVNGGNKEFEIQLRYNEVAGYWSMTLTDNEAERIIFSQLPLLASYYEFANMANQLGYKNIGSIYCIAMQMTKSCAPNSDDLGKKYILIWGDNEVM